MRLFASGRWWRRMTVPIRTLLCALLLLVASGCPVGPKFVKPEVPLPANWSASADPRLAKTAIDVAWWKSFKDPALDRLVELAYQQNLPLQIAGIRILEARAQLGIAVGRQFPTNQNPIGSASLNGLNTHPAGGNDL